MTAIKFSGIGLMILLAQLTVTVITLISTETGSRWIIQTALSDNQHISVEHISGTLINRLLLGQVQYHDGHGFSLTVDKLNIDWFAEALLQRHLHIGVLSLQGASIHGQPTSEKEGSSVLPSLPFDFSIDKLLISNVSWQKDGTHTGIEQVAVAVKLSNNQLVLTDIHFIQQSLTFTGHSNIALQKKGAISATLKWQAVLNETPIKGALKLSGDLDTLEIKSTIEGAFNTHQQGRINLSADYPTFDIQGDWQQLQWPLQQVAQIESKHGQFYLRGSTQHYELNVKAKVQLPKQGSFTVNFAGNGGHQQFDIKQMTLIPEHGEVTLSGQMSWKEAIAFNIQLSAKQLNLTDFVDNIPGSLDFSLQAKGHLDEDKLNAVLDISSLSGRIHGQPLHAQGRVSIRDRLLDFQAVKLAAGSNRLVVNGLISPDTANLDIAINAPDLNTAWPNLKGQLKGTLQVKGALKKPIIKSTIQGQGLHYKQISVGTLSLNADYSHGLQRASTIVFMAEDVHYAAHKIDLITVDGKGNAHNHLLQLKIQSAPLDLGLNTKGKWSRSQWLGHVEKLDITHNDLKYWMLQSPVELVISQPNKHYLINLKESCLVQSEADAKLCFSAERTANNQQNGQINVVNLPLEFANNWLPDDILLEGRISAQAHLTSVINHLKASVNMDVEHGVAVIKDKDGVGHDVPFQDSTFKLTYQADQLKSRLHLGLGGADYMMAEVNIDDVATDQHLSGFVKGKVKKMKVVGGFFPEIAQLQGLFVTDIQLAGHISQPIVKGSAVWKEGSFIIPALGSAIKHINVQVNSDEKADRLAFNIDMTSGEGTLEGQGWLDLKETSDFPLYMTLKGSHFQLCRLPEAEISISPSIKIEQHANLTEVKGVVNIDSAQIEMKTLPDSAVALSEDEVIISTKKERKKSSSLFQLDTHITINFGEESYFTGLGLKTRLAGQLIYAVQQKKQTMHGRAVMRDASYSSYGQELAIRKGEFIFDGSTDNPWLSIEAIRKATTDDVTAVLNVTGLLKAPETNIYTEPSLSKSEAISYLITGRPSQGMSVGSNGAVANAVVNYGIGELSGSTAQLGIDVIEYNAKENIEDSTVNLGKHLTSDLYIGVGMGLFADKYEALLRYRLTKNISVHTRTGETGRIDFKYHLKTD